jgi:hypothetical protein
LGRLSASDRPLKSKARLMSTKPPRPERNVRTEHRPLRVRLPGFVGEEAIGLGDAVSRVAHAVGVKPCGGCTQRADWLNHRMIFVGSNHRPK